MSKKIDTLLTIHYFSFLFYFLIIIHQRQLKTLDNADIFSLFLYRSFEIQKLLQKVQQIQDQYIKNNTKDLDTNIQQLQQTLQNDKKLNLQKDFCITFIKSHLQYFIDMLQILQFETRKRVSSIINIISLSLINNEVKTIDVEEKLITQLLLNCSENETCPSSANILQSLLLFQNVRSLFYQNKQLRNQLTELMQSQDFEITSEVTSVFECLFKYTDQDCLNEIQQNFEAFSETVNQLLQSQNFACKKYSIKFLADFLLSEYGDDAREQYTSKAYNLKVSMQLLSSQSKNIQQEAFNIFKIFAVNPEKTKEITQILIKNRKKLVEMIQSIQSPELQEEIDYVIQSINDLEEENKQN